MKTLAIVCVALWVLVVVLYQAARHGQRDDFGAGMIVWWAACAAAICTLVLGALAVMNSLTAA